MSLYLEKGGQGSVCCIAKVAQLVRRSTPLDALVPHWTRVATGFCRAIYALDNHQSLSSS
jgi:hypothetical protein